MWLSRTAYLCILVVATFFYAAHPFWFTWYLWVLILLFAPFDLLVSLPGMLTRRIALTAPYTLEQDEAANLLITNLSNSPFPSGSLKVRLFVSGEQGVQSFPLYCARERGSQAAFTIYTSKSWVIHFNTKKLWAYSLMGLFSLPVKAEHKTYSVILPRPEKPPRKIMFPVAQRAFPKPGGGYSEDHELRPYRLGDPINAMHWKLSAKFDSLILREAIAPPPLKRLIRLTLWNSSEERELILGRLRWSSTTLLRKGWSHYVRIGREGKLASITRSDDLVAFLHQSLTDEEVMESPFVSEKFTWIQMIDARDNSRREEEDL